MRYEKSRGPAPRVAEPVQVYLKPDDQDRLLRLTDELGTSKSDVLRRGLRALEQQLTDPRDHPALRVIGLGSSSESESASGIPGPGEDAAREHDRLLADSEEGSWRHEDRDADRESSD